MAAIPQPRPDETETEPKKPIQSVETDADPSGEVESGPHGPQDQGGL